MKKIKNLNFSKLPRSNLKSKFPWSDDIKSLPPRLYPCSQISMSNIVAFLTTVTLELLNLVQNDHHFVHLLLV